MRLPRRSSLTTVALAAAAVVALFPAGPTPAQAQLGPGDELPCVGGGEGMARVTFTQLPPEGLLITITADGSFSVVCQLPFLPQRCVSASATVSLVGSVVTISGSGGGTFSVVCGPEGDDDDLEPPPVSTEGCHVTYGGWITPVGGGQGTFGGNARATSSTTVEGQQQYQDHPAFTFHSLNVRALVCPADEPGRATIFGDGEVDGAGPVRYRIDLRDAGEPGTADTYRIQLDGGYDSGEQILEGGNVQFHPPEG